MDIRGLRYFIKLAECLNFTHAARECFITQTAMSQNIAKMEEELGFQLFRRNNRTVELTPAGRDFYGKMYLLVKDYDEAVTHCSNLANGKAGQLRIAVSNCVDSLILMSCFREFRDTYPEVRLKVHIKEPHFFNDFLRQRKVDAVINWNYGELQQDEDMCVESFAEYSLMAAVGKGHPFAGKKVITGNMLDADNSTFLGLKCVTGITKDLEQWTGEANGHFQILKRKSTEELLLEVEMDDQMALLPGYMEHHVTGNVDFLRFDMEEVPKLGMTVEYMKKNDNPSLKKFIDILYKVPRS